MEAAVSITAHSRSPCCVLTKQKTVAESLKRTISFALTRIKDEGSEKTELAVNHAEAEFRSRYSSNGSGMSGARKAYEELLSLSDSCLFSQTVSSRGTRATVGFPVHLQYLHLVEAEPSFMNKRGWGGRPASTWQNLPEMEDNKVTEEAHT